jgi:hypothetical protein
MGEHALAVVTIDDAAEQHSLDPGVMRQFVMDGDLTPIKPEQRPALVMALCRHIGVDPIERPFLVFKDGKRTVLYAARACTSALCRVRGISRQLLAVQEVTMAGQPVIIARARATLPDGRFDESTGVVPVMQEDTAWEGPEGNKRKVSKGWRQPNPSEAANLPMKAETKAKRRAVLDLVGLGMPDESEIETIRGARRGHVDMTTGELQFESAPAALPSARPAVPDLVRDIDARVKALATALDMRPKTVYGRALRTIDASGYPAGFASPGDLHEPDARAVLSFLDAKLAELEAQVSEAPAPTTAADVAAAYRRLCASSPDYKPNDWRKEWADMAGIAEWPDSPGTELLKFVLGKIAEIQEKIDHV